jgi:hypothetical protein
MHFLLRWSLSIVSLRTKSHDSPLFTWATRASAKEKGRVMDEWLMHLGFKHANKGEGDNVYQSVVVFDAFVKFWCHPSRSHLVNKEFCKISFARAVDLLLDGKECSARIELIFCITFKAMVEKGG